MDHTDRDHARPDHRDRDPVASDRDSGAVDPRCRDTTRERDGGQAALLVVCVAAVLLVAVLTAVATMGRTVLDRQRAQTAADAAALASVVGGRADAVELAAQHGAAVVSWRTGPGPDEVTVVVRVGDTTATARASDAP